MLGAFLRHVKMRNATGVNLGNMHDFVKCAKSVEFSLAKISENDIIGR